MTTRDEPGPDDAAIAARDAALDRLTPTQKTYVTRAASASDPAAGYRLLREKGLDDATIAALGFTPPQAAAPTPSSTTHPAKPKAALIADARRKLSDAIHLLREAGLDDAAIREVIADWTPPEPPTGPRPRPWPPVKPIESHHLMLLNPAAPESERDVRRAAFLGAMLAALGVGKMPRGIDADLKAEAKAEVRRMIRSGEIDAEGRTLARLSRDLAVAEGRAADFIDSQIASLFDAASPKEDPPTETDPLPPPDQEIVLPPGWPTPVPIDGIFPRIARRKVAEGREAEARYALKLAGLDEDSALQAIATWAASTRRTPAPAPEARPKTAPPSLDQPFAPAPAHKVAASRKRFERFLTEDDLPSLADTGYGDL